MEEQKKEFYYEPSIWPFFITPTLLIMFLSSILIPYLVSPLFWSLLLPTSKNPPRFNMQFTLWLRWRFMLQCWPYIYLVSGEMNSNRVFSKSPLGFVTIQMSLGFFAGDFIVCLLDPKLRSDWGDMIRHAAAIGSLVFCLFYQGILMVFCCLSAHYWVFAAICKSLLRPP